MQVRIFHIAGRAGDTREQRLARLSQWMEQHGWRLVDYADEARSAVFERPEDAPVLPRWHLTRWAPGPEFWRPSVLLGERRLLSVILVGVLVVGLAGLWNFLPANLIFAPHNDSLDGEAGVDFRGTQVMFVGAGTLNVRAEPSVDSRIVGLLQRNEKVRVDRKRQGWARVISPEQGYVALRHLREAPQR